jgi:hypothetical protein
MVLNRIKVSSCARVASEEALLQCLVHEPTSGGSVMHHEVTEAASYIGFIFYMSSKQYSLYLSYENTARKILTSLSSRQCMKHTKAPRAPDARSRREISSVQRCRTATPCLCDQIRSFQNRLFDKEMMLHRPGKKQEATTNKSSSNCANIQRRWSRRYQQRTSRQHSTETRIRSRN